MKPYGFENAPLLKAFSKRPGTDNELDQPCVNKRGTASKPMLLQMKLRPCKQCLKQAVALSSPVSTVYTRNAW